MQTWPILFFTRSDNHQLISTELLNQLIAGVGDALDGERNCCLSISRSRSGLMARMMIASLADLSWAMGRNAGLVSPGRSRLDVVMLQDHLAEAAQQSAFPSSVRPSRC